MRSRPGAGCRLRRAERVDAAADDLDGLIDGAADRLVHAGFGIGQRDQAVRRRRVTSRSRAGLAEDGIADGLRQLAQLRQQPVAVGGVRHADLDAARMVWMPPCGAQRVSRRTRRTSSRSCVSLGAEQVGHVDLEQDVRAALQVEAEHDGAGGA